MIFLASVASVNVEKRLCPRYTNTMHSIFKLMIVNKVNAITDLNYLLVLAQIGYSINYLHGLHFSYVTHVCKRNVTYVCKYNKKLVFNFVDFGSIVGGIISSFIFILIWEWWKRTNLRFEPIPTDPVINQKGIGFYHIKVVNEGRKYSRKLSSCYHI